MEKKRRSLVHRKGATRAFGPGHDEVAARYREIGQPVIIGGSMETGSYLLVGTASGAETFFSTAHGSGRTMSRTKARKQWHGKQLQRDLGGARHLRPQHVMGRPRRGSRARLQEYR